MENVEIVLFQFTLELEGLRNQRNLNEWMKKLAWRPTWHVMDTLSWSTRFCVKKVGLMRKLETITLSTPHHNSSYLLYLIVYKGPRE